MEQMSRLSISCCCDSKIKYLQGYLKELYWDRITKVINIKNRGLKQIKVGDKVNILVNMHC